MDRDTISRTAAQALVVGGSLLTAVALIGPATWRQGEAHGKPSAAVLVTIFLLGPALSGLCENSLSHDSEVTVLPSSFVGVDLRTNAVDNQNNSLRG